MANKGRSERSTLTANDRVRLRRRRWHAPGGGGVPVDALLDAAEATVSLGARERCCRSNAATRSFAQAAEPLRHVGQVRLSSELPRPVVEAEGQRVLKASEDGSLSPGWQASDCKVLSPAGQEVSRVYLGIDGFMAPLLTEAEKQARRKQVVAARRQRGRNKPKLPALPRRKKGADQRYKEFKRIQFHDETMDQRRVSVTKGNCQEAIADPAAGRGTDRL